MQLLQLSSDAIGCLAQYLDVNVLFKLYACGNSTFNAKLKQGNRNFSLVWNAIGFLDLERCIGFGKRISTTLDLLSIQLHPYVGHTAMLRPQNWNLFPKSLKKLEVRFPASADLLLHDMAFKTTFPVLESLIIEDIAVGGARQGMEALAFFPTTLTELVLLVPRERYNFGILPYLPQDLQVLWLDCAAVGGGNSVILPKKLATLSLVIDTPFQGLLFHELPRTLSVLKIKAQSNVTSMMPESYFEQKWGAPFPHLRKLSLPIVGDYNWPISNLDLLPVTMTSCNVCWDWKHDFSDWDRISRFSPHLKRFTIPVHLHSMADEFLSLEVWRGREPETLPPNVHTITFDNVYQMWGASKLPNSLTELRCYRILARVDDIGFPPNLKILDCHSIASIASLPVHLTDLTFHNTHVSDFEALSKLTSLKRFSSKFGFGSEILAFIPSSVTYLSLGFYEPLKDIHIALLPRQLRYLSLKTPAPCQFTLEAQPLFPLSLTYLDLPRGNATDIWDALPTTISVIKGLEQYYKPPKF